MNLPFFNLDGVLPAGDDFKLTFDGIRQSHLITGACSSNVSDWDREGRLHLLENFEMLVNCLWKVGVEEVFLGGSFVEDKPKPQDIDGCFLCPNADELRKGQFSKYLDDVSTELMREQRVWYWGDRIENTITGRRELRMKHYYHVELIPYSPDMKNAITIPATGERLPIPVAFRKRHGDLLSKGIVQVIRDDHDNHLISEKRKPPLIE